MEKIETAKKELTERLRQIPEVEPDLPVDTKTFEEFKATFGALLARENDPVAKSFIIQKIVHKIRVHDEGVTITFNLDKSHFDRETRLNAENGFEAFNDTKQKVRGVLSRLAPPSILGKKRLTIFLWVMVRKP